MLAILLVSLLKVVFDGFINVMIKLASTVPACTFFICEAKGRKREEVKKIPLFLSLDWSCLHATETKMSFKHHSRQIFHIWEIERILWRCRACLSSAKQILTIFLLTKARGISRTHPIALPLCCQQINN